MFFYAGGVDALYNFYDKNNRSFGVFAGLMVGWNSWSMGESKQCAGTAIYSPGGFDGGCVSTNKFFQQLLHTDSEYYPEFKTSSSFAFVQAVVNLGFRFNFTKHQGLEVGVRIPTINTPGYVSKGAFLEHNIVKVELNDSLTFRRDIAAFIDYVISF
ncbi:outer membrane protein [Helicobacter gastrofelis]|nr:outer membrane protein [Helicobacter sp. NHP19-012]